MYPQIRVMITTEKI